MISVSPNRPPRREAKRTMLDSGPAVFQVSRTVRSRRKKGRNLWSVALSSLAAIGAFGGLLLLLFSLIPPPCEIAVEEAARNREPGTGSVSRPERNRGRIDRSKSGQMADARHDASVATDRPTDSGSAMTHLAVAGSENRDEDRLATSDRGVVTQGASELDEVFKNLAADIPTWDVAAATADDPLADLPTSKALLAANLPGERILPASDQAILEHYDDHKLFTVKQYLPLRHVFAQSFAEQHKTEIQAAFDSQHDEIVAWLEQNEDLKEELYTAIEPGRDDIVSALSIFRELKNGFPSEVVAFGDLAIAVAVTWDQEQLGVYDYADHQRRTKSEMPELRANALDNFAYLVQTDTWMQGRGRFLPWEFLVHVVNHKTPLDERQWALANYLPRRAMIGHCYHDVPYDREMLDSGDRYTRLEGKPYTLPNLRTYGGVCCMQADYASRVAKCLGVPAVYVGGTSCFGEGHAWVMWIELTGVTGNRFAFNLESHGRYDYDRYYVGYLQDPQTGATITDRQLALRLHTVGMNAINKRHAALLMRAFPVVREHRGLDLREQVDYLNHVIAICPGNESAWIELSKLSHELAGRVEYRKAMARTLDQLFVVFCRFPDFTWTIFGDLTAYEDDPVRRIQLYERLVAMYVSAGRPDLASQATLKLCDLLEEQRENVRCLERLALTIKAFAQEGAYVPPMLDRLEMLCKRVHGADDHLQRFYLEFLSLIPQKRGDRPSQYCASMYERAISLFRERGRDDIAQMIAVQLANVMKDS